VPEGRHAFLFALLRTALPPTPEHVAALVAKNRAIYEQLVALDGTRYPIDSVPMSRADWRQHFGPFWASFVLKKERFDPDNVLTPGQRIFC
jgi:cytokinin dehydrogenase